MEQPALFQDPRDLPPLNRPQDALLEAIRDCNASGDAPTAMEAAAVAEHRYGRMRETYRKRVKELVDSGYVEKVGRRRCQITRNPASTYRVVC